MIKVLMINTVPMIFDGIGMTILNYMGNLDRQDMVVDIVVINHVDEEMRSQIEGMGSHIYELTDRNSSQLKYICSLARVVRNGKYDIVHIHCNSCTAAVDLLGAKLGGAKMLCPHSHNTKCIHTRAHKMLRPLFDLLYTEGFACGDLAGKWLFQNKSFTVLHNATNTEKYRFSQTERDRIRTKYELQGKVAVGHVAHFTYHKNHPFLLESWAEVIKRDSRYILFLIGDGKLRDEMETLVNNLGIDKNVVFTGTTLEIPAYLSAMDMMVLPSLWEGLPNVVIEWQVAGLPTLVSDTVTKDCKLTDSVKFLPLVSNKWVKEIVNTDIDIDRSSVSENNIIKITETGFCIEEQAALLKEYYIKRIGNNGKRN